ERVWGTAAGEGGGRCIEPKEKVGQPETLASSAFLENEMALLYARRFPK
ncbi:MAG: hypothetical protein RLZZ597_2319, partial [Cyanobacteriota bacterium]